MKARAAFSMRSARQRSTGRDRHGRYDSSVASRASREPGSTVHRTRVSVTLRSSATKAMICSLYRTTPSNPGSSCWIATNGVCYGNMEGLNDLRSASGKGWIGIGRPCVSWRAARPQLWHPNFESGGREFESLRARQRFQSFELTAPF